MKRQIPFRLLSIGVVLLLLPPALLAAQRNLPTERAPMPGSRGTYDRPLFFPLEVGNEWVYSDGAGKFTVQVLRETIEANGLKYFEVSGYWPNDPARTRKLRRAFPDQIYEYNPQGEDFLWYQFGNLSASWRFNSGDEIPCITGSSVAIGALDAKVETPAGMFERALRLDFASRCADGGIANEYYAGGVGLVQRVLNTIAGPRTVRLIAAHLGGTEFPPSYGIGISLDRPLYYNNLMPPVVDPSPTARVRLTVRNDTEWPVKFTFPTSQRFDFIVQDSQGKELLRWSDGRTFLEVIGEETLLKESSSYSADLVLRARDGKLLPAGFYRITGYLTTQGSGPNTMNIAATAGFEIRDLH
jgi:hypothetical protein